MSLISGFAKMKFLMTIFISAFILVGCSTMNSFTTQERKIRVLIVDGQNNHDVWPRATHIVKQWLEDSGQFEVAIARTQYVWKSQRFGQEYRLDDGKAYQEMEPKTDPEFAPNFSQYDVVISNFGWRAAEWPEATKRSFETYMANGGGLVVIHAANNSFPQWPAFNQMIGLGGWGGRDETSGPYVYFDHLDKKHIDNVKGHAGGHGKQYVFDIKVREQDHPITREMPQVWRHTKDELYHKLRGPAKNMTILATAYDDPNMGGSGRHEPVMMTIDYFQGRVFHSTLGHDLEAYESQGFRTSIVRGAEWAATGKVR